MITISSFNVNSIKARFDIVKDYLFNKKIDILLLQEIKCVNENFPTNEFEKLGYFTMVNGQKSYNGVAIISKFPIDLVSKEFFDSVSDELIQARFLDVKILDYRVICIYAPNGNPINTEKYEYKIKWFNQFKNYCQRLYDSNEKIIIGGDFNIIPGKIDCYNPREWENDALYTEEVKKILYEILNIGFVDSFRSLHPLSKSYSFWDYQNGAWQKDNGIRIDFLLLSPETHDLLQNSGIDKDLRSMQRPSDHTPTWVRLHN